MLCWICIYWKTYPFILSLKVKVWTLSSNPSLNPHSKQSRSRDAKRKNVQQLPLLVIMEITRQVFSCHQNDISTLVVVQKCDSSFVCTFQACLYWHENNDLMDILKKKIQKQCINICYDDIRNSMFVLQPDNAENPQFHTPAFTI